MLSKSKEKSVKNRYKYLIKFHLRMKFHLEIICMFHVIPLKTIESNRNNKIQSF